MADIPINPVTRRVEFTGNTGTGPFAFTFNVLAQADVAAYKNNTLLALTSDYTVSLNSNGTGSITLTSALIATDELVIIGDLALSRTTDFVTAGDLLASSLNEQFDSNVVMSQQLDERFDRTIRSQPGDINKNLYLPLVSSRASQLLSFDSSGNITTTSLSNVPDIGTVNLTVSGVASFADGSASAPSITNIGDTNTGMYFGAADQINFSIGGSEVISVASTGTTISGLSISSGDILLTDNSATALEIKEGSNNYLTFITTNGSEKISFGSTANPTFEVNGSFRQPLIAATTSFFSQTYSGATLAATNGSVNIESYSASKAGIVLNGSGDQITFTSPTLGFVGLVQVVGAITTNTSLNIASSTTVDGILDEDDMSSNSATKLATQQSIKAYVDAQVGTVDTLAEVLGNGNTTGGTDIAVSSGDDITFADSSKAIFGAGSDLQIYHDGAINSSLIYDAGGGDLLIRGTNMYLQDADGNSYIGMTDNGTGGKVSLRFNTAEKLVTTITGIDVTGTVTADGLTVDGSNVLIGTNTARTDFSGNSAVLQVEGTDLVGSSVAITRNTNNAFGPVLYLNKSRGTADSADTILNAADIAGEILFQGADGNQLIRLAQIEGIVDGTPSLGDMPGRLDFSTTASGASTPSQRMRIGSNGDISFYEDTGTTAKFFWDASAEGLSLGHTSNTSILDVLQSDNITDVADINSGAKFGRVNSSGNGQTSGLFLLASGNGGSNNGWAGMSVVQPDANSNNADLTFITRGSSIAERMRIDSSGRVGIGTSSPQNKLSVGSTSDASTAISINSTSSGFGTLRFNDDASESGQGRVFYDHTNNAMGFMANSSEAMRIDSSGNLLVGKTTGGIATDGFQANAAGYATITDTSFSPLILNRKTLDGTILDLQKDGSPVGSIGVGGSNDLTIGDGPAGLIMDGDGATPIVGPWNTSTNSTSDASVDLGYASGRFRDLYLSGGVYLGGVVGANKLDDYEEGTWTPSIGGASANPTVTYTLQNGFYTKVGRMVYIEGRVDISAYSGGSGLIELDGLPFTSIDPSFSVLSISRISTWSADYTGRIGPSWIVLNGDTRCFMYSSDNTSGGVDTFSTAVLQAGSSLTFSGCYETS